MRETPMSFEAPGQAIRRRRNQVLLRGGYAQLFRQLVVIALVIWIVFTQFFALTRASGQGMFPAVKDGDLVFAYRLQQEYVKDDVVIYTAGGETRVGRVAAIGTDVVDMSDEGTLTVNGTQQDGEIMYPTYKKEGLTYPYTVPEGSVFILGDYRTQSEDSRDFGAVELKNVSGKVITILRRRGI